MWQLSDGVEVYTFAPAYAMADAHRRGIDEITATGGTARYIHGSSTAYTFPVTRVDSASVALLHTWHRNNTALSLTSPTFDVSTVVISSNRLPLDTFSRSDSNLRDGNLELVALA